MESKKINIAIDHIKLAIELLKELNADFTNDIAVELDQSKYLLEKRYGGSNDKD